MILVLVIINSKSSSSTTMGAQGWSWFLLSQGPAQCPCPAHQSGAPGSTPTPVPVLTLLQLVPNHSEEGYRDHEQVDDEASLAELPDGGATQLSNHALVGNLAADGGSIAQDDQPTDQEDQGDLQSRTVGQGALTARNPSQLPRGLQYDSLYRASHLQRSRLPSAWGSLPCPETRAAKLVD